MSTLTQTDEAIVARVEAAGERIQRVHKAASAVVFGQEQVIEHTLITLLCGGMVAILVMQPLRELRHVVARPGPDAAEA